MRRELEVMHVLRVPPLGKLVVDINGERYQNLTEMVDEKARRVILTAIGELVDFAGGYQTLVDAGVASPISGSAATPAEEAELEKRQAEFLAQLEAERDALRMGDPQQKTPPSLQELPAAPSPPAPTPEPASIAAQIDEILQKHKTADPELAERSIHLVEDAAGGLQIEVDGKRYQKPSDIREQKIQLLIKRAVQEWNAS